MSLRLDASGSVQWTIGLSEVVTDSDFEVSGTIKVTNVGTAEGEDGGSESGDGRFRR